MAPHSPSDGHFASPQRSMVDSVDLIWSMAADNEWFTHSVAREVPVSVSGTTDGCDFLVMNDHGTV